VSASSLGSTRLAARSIIHGVLFTMWKAREFMSLGSKVGCRSGPLHPHLFLEIFTVFPDSAEWAVLIP